MIGSVEVGGRESLEVGGDADYFGVGEAGVCVATAEVGAEVVAEEDVGFALSFEAAAKTVYEALLGETRRVELFEAGSGEGGHGAS